MDTINTNIDTNSVDKKKKHFIPKFIAILTSAFSIIGVGTCLLIKNQYKSALAVSYNDDSYVITFDANELSNYTFNNLNTYLYDNYTDFSFGDWVFYSVGDDYSFYYDDSALDSNVYFLYLYSTDDDTPIVYNFGFNYDNTLINKFSLTRNDEDYGFDSYFQWILTNDSVSYSGIKNAIELDIEVNQYTNNTFLQDIVELLVGGIVAFSGGFATGLNSLVSALAIQNGAMSPFISIVLIFGGLALAFGLSRWVVNLISSLGQRNR